MKRRIYCENPRVFRPHSSTNWDEIVPSIHEPMWYRVAKLVAGLVMGFTILWGVIAFFQAIQYINGGGL